MKNLRTLAVILLCTALFTGYEAKAQDVIRTKKPVIPSKIEGNWALPDCRSYDEAMIVTRHFYLESDREGSQFWPVESVGKEKDYWILNMKGKKHPVRVEEDGVLKIGMLSEHAPKEWPKNWEALMLDGKKEYMGCADIPALLPDPLVRVMVHMSALEATCGASLTQNCKRLLFKIADNDKNKKISMKEMKMAGAMLAGLAAVIEKDTATRADLDKTLYDSLRESDRIAPENLRAGQELNERQFSDFVQKTDSPLLHEALATISLIFPAFEEKETPKP